jgi:hypothetical protein
MIRNIRGRAGRLGGGATLAVFMLSITPSGLQAADVGALKAAFLYNFAKFAEWPDDVLPSGKRLALCVVGDANVADALEQTIKGRAIDTHELTVQIVKPDGPLAACHLLYVSAGELKHTSATLVVLRTQPVLTVSDADHFAENGGIAQLIVENDRMRFAVNPKAIERSRLRLSAKLLSLAQIIKDDPNALR